METLYRIETFEGLVWTGSAFSYDEMDAELFDTEDEAVEAASGIKGVFVEKFQRPSSRPTPIASRERSAA